MVELRCRAAQILGRRGSDRPTFSINQHQHRRPFGVPPSGGPARLKPELQTSINEDEHRRSLRRLHHVLKLPVSRDRRFQLGRNRRHRFQEFSFTRHLTPALSPNSRWRRGRIIRRLFENSRDWICRTAIRQTRNVQQLFPLLGERIKGEGERPNKIHSGSRPSQNEYRKRVPVRPALRDATSPPVSTAAFGLQILELAGAGWNKQS